jgi:hypothetical protein
VSWFAQYLIDQARSLGYRLVTLGECLGDPPANWYRDPRTGQPYGAAGLNASITSSPPQPSPSLSSDVPSDTGASSSVSASLVGSSSALVGPTPTPVPYVNFGAGTSPRDRPGFTAIGSSRTTTTIMAPAGTNGSLQAPLKSDAGRAGRSGLVILGPLLAFWVLLCVHL